MRTLYTLDFSNFTYKYKAVLDCTIDINGVNVNTSVLKGICNSVERIPYNDIAIVLDGTPRMSKGINSSYKGTRYHEESSTVYVPKLEVLDVMTQLGKVYGKNVSVICSPNQETDQVISSIVHYIVKDTPRCPDFVSRLNTFSLSDDPVLSYIPGSLEPFDLRDFGSVVIGSSDADFIQLLRFDNIYIDSSTTGYKISRETTSKSTSETTPCASILYKALIGDSSDNIPKLDLKGCITVNALIKLLNETVTSDDIISQFYRRVFGINTSTQTSLDKIADYIKETNQVKQFSDNFDITKLHFVSFPRKLKLTNSTNVFDILSKYKITI